MSAVLAPGIEDTLYGRVGALPTPCLLLDKPRLLANIARMERAMARGGAPLRYHVKTTKCREVAALLGGPALPIAVSTLEEADQFAQWGYRDILYAVGIAPAKLDRVVSLRREGVDLSVLVDNDVAARAVADAARAHGLAIPALIEIDCDGTRAGVRPEDTPNILAIAGALGDAACLRGVLTHCGASYQSRSAPEIEAFAGREREAAVTAAAALRQAGFAVPVVSVGSTPTALFGYDFAGVTEVRAGVFAFFDLVMAGIGVCSPSDIALSVLASVLAVQPDRNRLVIDAGWMALSRDRGTASQPVDQGYGLVCNIEGRPWDGVVVTHANQEHGVVSARDGSGACVPDLRVGDLVRILPNHACATAAQHAAYEVLDGDRVATWRRFGGW